MAKLWYKDYELNELLEKFTVGNDYILDKRLVVSDCVSSIAHIHMLSSIGIIREDEYTALRSALTDIIKADLEGMEGVYIARLTLSDSKGRILSVNDYIMKGEGTEDFKALNAIKDSKLKARALAPAKNGNQRFEISNPSGNIALNLKFNLRDPKSGEIMLPAFFSDGYFHLMPGEKRIIEYHAPSAGVVSVEGYNVDNTTLKL